MNAAPRTTRIADREDPLSDLPQTPADAESNVGDPFADTDVPHGLPADPDRGRGLSATLADEQLCAWIAAIVVHDERALAALYDATVGRVFGLVRRIVRAVAIAEEVVEDVYFQIWRQAARFDPGRGKALTWLLSIARSRAIDALRRESRFQNEEADAGAHADAADHAAPEADELLDLARRQADLHQALALLGDQPRQLVSLAFFRGLSHEEIAHHTRMPLGTVKSQIRRALLHLRTLLGEETAPLPGS
ncbi:MAG: sigma-70 family RNA polymerase sigma factor [Proteobacteria bacterium]|nr:sigma-70 family RNA polymerase sigma factor [Pseudomonadota bacterium]